MSELLIDNIQIQTEEQDEFPHSVDRFGFNLQANKVWAHLKSYHVYMLDYKKETDTVIIQYNGNILHINATEGIIKETIVQVHKYNREEIIDDIKHKVNEFGNIIVHFPESFNPENVFFNFCELVVFQRQLETDVNIARKEINKEPYYTENPKKKTKTQVSLEDRLKGNEIKKALEDKPARESFSNSKVVMTGIQKVKLNITIGKK
jgi:hypothetical protein